MAGDVWLENWSWRNRRAGCVVDPRDVSDDDESCRARIIRRRRLAAVACREVLGPSNGSGPCLVAF